MTDNKKETQDPPARPEKVEPFEIPEFFKDFFDDYSLDVIENFGFDAPAKLNNYSCALEDALIEQVSRVQQLSLEVASLREMLKRASAHK